MKALENLKPLALLLLRAATGVIFLYHGYPKLFAHAREAAQGFVHMGFPGFFAYVAGVLELFGGVLLVLGLFTRIVALLLAGEMLVALWRVHGLFTHPFAVHNYEFPLMLAVGAFSLATMGAGTVSFDHAIFRDGGKSAKKSKSKN